jgi:hypothetical protein
VLDELRKAQKREMKLTMEEKFFFLSARVDGAWLNA